MGQGTFQGLPGRVDGVWIYRIHLVTQVRFRWQGQHFRQQPLIHISLHGPREGIDEFLRHLHGFPLLVLDHHLQNDPLGKTLGRIPAVETITIVGHEKHEFLITIGVCKFYRRGKPPEQ